MTASMPHSLTPRPLLAPPISPPRPSSQETITANTNSLPPSSHHPRRPSISNTMHWLSRSSTQSSISTSYAPSKPTRISEPKLVRSFQQSRSGSLGSGATVVRTPDEALRETGVRLTFDGKKRDSLRDTLKPAKSTSHIPAATVDVPPSPPTSPPLPPLPLPPANEQQILGSSPSKSPPRPSRTPPAPPVPVLQPALRPALKSRSTDELPFSAPPLPSFIPTSSVPEFVPILISDVPSASVDPEKTIVTIETCTTTYRTTLPTICSRSSHLASYLSSLLETTRNSTASSVYSTNSDDMAAYRQHLTSQGLLSPAPPNIHIFLDRPSAPYLHIMTYLRSPTASPECPEALPIAVQLQCSSHSQSRLESLLELRDEAAYLNLEGLYKLCTAELRLRQSPRLHYRGASSASSVGSVQSQHASIYSLHTLVEHSESGDVLRRSRSSDIKSAKGSHISYETHHPPKSPPTPPQSWEGHHRGRSKDSTTNPSASVPAGWI